MKRRRTKDGGEGEKGEREKGRKGGGRGEQGRGGGSGGGVHSARGKRQTVNIHKVSEGTEG